MIGVCQKATLPLQLMPSQAVDLIRLGSKTDGGYVVRKADVLASDGLISMGIDRDWLFERHFVRIKAVPVHAYDGCTSTAYMLEDARDAFRHRNLRWLATSLARAVDYHWFFRGPRRHFRQFVGTDEFAYRNTGSPTLSLDNVMAAMPGHVFLKIDIEGGEFGMLDEVVKYAPRTSALVIEFHDCEEHLEQIVRFVEGYPLRLVHTHVNSYSCLGPRGVPQAVELTFSSTAPKALRPATLPHPLDAPNDGVAEMPVSFTRML